ncbi:MAG: DUF459 domain-containing protein [Actinomycetota bacterium]
MAESLLQPLPSLEDPEPAPIVTAPARRRVRSRDAFVTKAVCLGLWAVLFAPALLRGAEGGPVGARRSAALAVLRPLSSLSDALAIEDASTAMMSALGRDPEAQAGGELELPLDLPPLPPLPVDDEPARPSPQGPASPSPEGDRDRVNDDDGRGEPAAGIRTPDADAELRVAVVGDSLSQGLGPAIEQWFDPDVSRVLALGRQSTGLARQDYFNWQAAMRQLEEAFRPDLLFVLLGSNDNQAQVTRDGEDVGIGSVAWTLAYRERAAAFLEEATSNGTHVVWVGIPVVRDRQRWDFYGRVNEIYEQTAAADPLATYVDAWDLFQLRGGGYSAFLRNERGVVQEMRAGDGIHLTPTGYGYLAREAIRAAAREFDLPQRAVTIRI